MHFCSDAQMPRSVNTAPAVLTDGCVFFLLNPRAVFTQATSSHAEARSPRFVRVLAAGFASLRAFLSKAALSSAHFRPASLDLGLAFRWPVSRARRQMRGDRIKCLGLRTYRTSCINATDSICRRARMESQSVVKLGQWAQVENAPKKAQLSKGDAPATKSSGPPTSNTRSFAKQSRKRVRAKRGEAGRKV